MTTYQLPHIDPRLNQRYQQLVSEHCHVGDKLAAGVRAMIKPTSAFASTQAAWRFYQNESIHLEHLMSPLLDAAHHGMEHAIDNYALVVHDWSRLQYCRHKSKTDRLQMSHKYDVGYDLQSALLISDQNGLPIALLVQNLQTQDQLHSTYHQSQARKPQHLEELSHRLSWLESQKWEKKLVHIVDREAD